MSFPEYVIDLSGVDDDSILPSNFSTEKKLITRPASLTLKSIGIGLIKMQFFENSVRPFVQEKAVENGWKTKKEDLWKSAWEYDPKDACNYQFRHMLDQRLDKSFRCPISRSRLCQNPSKMTRLSWIEHQRRGHVRINCLWKKILKRNNNSNPIAVLEIDCVICPKSKKTSAFTQTNFVHHMKKHHPQFVPYNEQLSHFQRCFICNDETKSFQQSISHRQLCIAALLKDPNQGGTGHFNNCFKTQRLMPTLSLDASINNGANFMKKFKQLDNLSCSALHFWMQLNKNGITHSSVHNGLKPHQPITKGSLITPQPNISTNKTLTNSKWIISDRIAPGSQIDAEKQERFIIPVPFLIKNESQSKKTYIKWRKSIRDEHSLMKSNVPWHCELCNAMLKNSRSAYCHTRMCHPTVEFKEMTCKSCGKKFLTSIGFNNHFNGKNKCPVARRCVACNIAVSISDIYQHMFLKHKDDFESILRVNACLICRYKVDNIADHLFNIHGMTNVISGGQSDVGRINYRNGSFFNCAKCALTYFSELELRNHMIRSDHYLECASCPSLKFFLSWELMNHLSLCRNHDSSNSSFSCPLCRSNINQPELIFHKASQQIQHFIEFHLSPCSVLLKDIGTSE